MKQLLISLMGALAITASACWFTDANYNATYIAGVNNLNNHYIEVANIANVEYKNGASVDLPIQVQVKVSDRIGDQSGESNESKPVVTAILQYKVISASSGSTNWITVKTLENMDWDMNYDIPVTLWGTGGTIETNNIAKGDTILIRVYFSDGYYETGDLSEDFDASDVPDVQTRDNVRVGNTSWKAPHVFRVVWSGKTRVII